MPKYRKLVAILLSLIGVFILVLIILLVIYFNPAQHNSQPTPSQIVMAPSTIPIRPPTENALSNEGKRTIPFQSVVLITAMYYDNGSLVQGWTGSGTVVSKNGLILTNAHVVIPGENSPVDLLTIAPTVSADEKPHPSFTAKVVQADSKLDLAVIKIVGDLSGNPIDAASLNLPVVKLGDSDKLTLGDKLTILGYPGIGGETITLTSGEVSGFTSEAGIGNRAFIKTSATIAGGNSGGLAADDAGELIGIPTQLGSGSDTGIVDCRYLADTNSDGMIDENDTCIPTGGFINSLRPINLAKPLIEAALRGEQKIVAINPTQAAQAPREGKILFQDDFSNPNSGWENITDSDGLIGYSNGTYIISVTSPNMVLSGTSGQNASDVIMKVTARVIQSTGKGDYGMICRQQEDRSYYAFEIREDGYASIWKNYSNTIVPLIDWQNFPFLAGRSAANFTVACIGDQLTLAVDGQTLLAASDSDFTAGDTGLAAGTLSNGGFIAAFDNFSLQSP